jgi:hypothetical protein
VVAASTAKHLVERCPGRGSNPHDPKARGVSVRKKRVDGCSRVLISAAEQAVRVSLVRSVLFCIAAYHEIRDTDVTRAPAADPRTAVPCGRRGESVAPRQSSR